jgi:hypothetical protein
VKWKAVLFFVAGFLTAGVLVVCAAAAKRIEACRIVDLTAGFDPQQAKDGEAMIGGWIHHARHCVIGRYAVDVPATPESNTIFVGQDGHGIFFASKDGITVLDHDHPMYEWNRAKNFMTVDTYDSAQRAWIEHIDSDADGTMDARMTTFTDGRPPKIEFRGGDRLLELVVRDGRKGAMVDGQFMSVDEARAKFTSSAGRK